MIASKPLIVIVDDDESVRRTIRRLIRSLGMEAEAFKSGQEFLDLCEAMPSYEPGCVILDVQMPGMNGLDVQQQLVKSRKKIPVIFITAHDDLGARERALAAGAIAFIRKPFQDEILIKTMRQALNRI